MTRPVAPCCRPAPGVAGRVDLRRDVLPCRSQAAYGLGEVLGRGGPGDPEEAVQPALDGEQRAGGDDHAAPFGLDRGRRAERLRQLAPQRQPAVGHPERPLRQVLADRGHQHVAPGHEPLAVERQHLVRVVHQVSEHELLEHRCAQVEPDARVDQPLHLVEGSAHPAQSQTAPVGLARAADRDRVVGVRRERTGHRRGEPGSQRERLVGLVGHDDRAGAGQGRRELLALRVGHQVAGGVLEVGDQVGQPRRGLAQGGAERVEVPAVGVDGRRHQPSARVAYGLGRVGIGRRLDHHPVARRGEGLRDDGRGGERPGGHHHLLGDGREAAGVVRRRDPRLQCGHAEREVARAAEVGGQLLGRALVGLDQPGRGGVRRAVEVDDVLAAGAGHERPVVRAPLPAGDGGEGARAAARLGVARLAQHLVGAGHRRPGHVERAGQLALARQADADADPPVADHHPQAVGESQVGGGTGEVADESGYALGTDETAHAGHCSTIGYVGQGQSRA